MFDQNKLLIGNLIGGMSDCRSRTNDYLSKFERCWDFYADPKKQLKHWLNPDGKEVEYLQGLSPYGQDINLIFQSEIFGQYVLFPNPANELVTFESVNQDIYGGSLNVYTLTGRKIAQYEINDQQRISFDISPLEKGIYIIEFVNESVRFRNRLMVF